jgi:hypothetical protein
VTVDGASTAKNGHPQGPDVFNTTLFSASSLAYGMHQVKLANTPKTGGTFYMDIDWAVVELGDGDAKTSNTDSWVDDAAQNFTYGAGWTVIKNDLSSQYLDSTVQ